MSKLTLFTTISSYIKRFAHYTIVSILSLTIILGAMPTITTAESEDTESKFCKVPGYQEVVKSIRMIVTAYSSTPDQTDSTPFITASGKYVTEGFVANNMLPFGTRIRIPELYGNRIFVVEDRMHRRKGVYHADIWFPEYEQAKEFGAKLVNIEVLES